MPAIACPYCNTTFDLQTAERAACPRCGETIPARLLPEGFVSSKMDAATSSSQTTGPRPVMIAAFLLLVLAISGSGIWYLTKGHDGSTVSTESKVPPATRPPLGLEGLKHIPVDAQIVLAIQPSPLSQYAVRVGKSPEAVLAGFGLPTSVMDGLKKAGIEFEQIDHMVLGVALGDSLPKLSIAMFLREPVANERRFREALQTRQNADKPGRAKIDWPGLPLPMEMHKLDDMTYLFSSDPTSLDGMLKPRDTFDAMKSGLRDSIKKLDAASFAWLATDNLDWANQPTLKLLAPLLKQPELPKRLTGIRAAAAGFALRPDLSMQMQIRFLDEPAAKAFESRAQPKLGDRKMELRTEKDWVSLELPEAEFKTGLPALPSLFDR